MADCTCCSKPVAPSTSPQPGAAVHGGRGLCNACHRRERYNGRLADHPRSTWSRDDVLNEWEVLRAEGHTRVQAAERLGMKPAAFERALQRARADGDPRALPGVAGGMSRAKAAVERAREAVQAAIDPATFEATPTARTRELEHAR